MFYQSRMALASLAVVLVALLDPRRSLVDVFFSFHVS
jgi:hypothetical protein